MERAICALFCCSQSFLRASIATCTQITHTTVVAAIKSFKYFIDIGALATWVLFLGSQLLILLNVKARPGIVVYYE